MRLETSPAALLIEHMHLILSELFVQQASDDSNELNELIPAGLEFMFSNGIDRDEGLTNMIRMNAEQLLQEMALRLGRARSKSVGRSRVAGQKSPRPSPT